MQDAFNTILFRKLIQLQNEIKLHSFIREHGCKLNKTKCSLLQMEDNHFLDPRYNSLLNHKRYSGFLMIATILFLSHLPSVW